MRAMDESDFVRLVGALHGADDVAQRRLNAIYYVAEARAVQVV